MPEPISKAVVESDLVVCSVLSGNSNFEARIHPEVKANYLASPTLVVAYALAGSMDVDLISEPLGQDRDGNDVYLRDLWPSADEIQETITRAVRGEMFSRTYADVFTGDPAWRELPIPEGDLFAWDPASTYVRQPPYFEGMSREPEAVEDVHGARCLVMLGDSVTTDHISPGRVDQAGLSGRQVPGRARRRAQGLQLLRLATRQPRGDGARDVRQRAIQESARAGVRGDGGRVHVPSGEEMTIYDASSDTSRKERRSSSSPARSTAPARRATGPPRAPTSSACGR